MHLRPVPYKRHYNLAIADVTVVIVSSDFIFKHMQTCWKYIFPPYFENLGFFSKKATFFPVFTALDWLDIPPPFSEIL